MTAEARKSHDSTTDLSIALRHAVKQTFANDATARQGLYSLRERLEYCTCGQSDRVAEGVGSPQDIRYNETISRILDSLDELILEFG